MSFFANFGKALYLVIAVTMVVMAVALITHSMWAIWQAYAEPDGDAVSAMLDAVGITVLALAVIDVSKYLVEEEVMRGHELRAPGEARARLTKFLTLISIAVSLEGLVFVFSAGKARPEALVYPAALLITAVVIVLGLGLYQWLSARTEQMTGKDGKASK